VRFNGQKATFMGIDVAPDANSLDVIKAVRKVLDEQIAPQLPQGLELKVVYDSTEYIQDSIDEVIQTIIEAILIVIVVIYLFLGNLRSVIIPTVTMPLSMVGALFLMWLMGFSINLLTLLAMVLAIGLVVDDAIIVLENVHRHIESGKKPFDAAMEGARELAWPVVAMTTTLISVFLPIGFLGGITGALFVEFAFSLAGAVFISGIIALTLTPMMTSKLLKAHDKDHQAGKIETFLDERFNRLRHAYTRLLHGALNDRPVILVFGGIIIVSCYFLFITSPSELAPKEDIGFVIGMSTADPYATLDYVEKYTEEVNRIASKDQAVDNIFMLNGIGGGGMSTASNTAITGFVLKPWTQRDKNTEQVQQSLQQQLNNVAGLQIATFMPPALPTSGGGMPVQFVIGSTGTYENLKEVGDEVLKRAIDSKKFIFIVSDLKIDKPQDELMIDREKAATLGLTMQEIGAQLAAMMAGGYTNYFALDNRSYKVIPQVERNKRLTAEQLKDYYIRTAAGQMIPLSTLVTIKTRVEPEQLNHFQQLNSVTLQGVPRPGVTLGDALGTLKGIAKDVLPPGYSVDYAGQSRQFEYEGSDLIIVFFFALIVIYLVLSAQFESFRDPLIMLVTVPMSICGAMIFVSLGLATLNIYTEVGLVTLIGVISKHGILIVEFANKLQDAGMSKRRAIEEAASIRLRPVLMTTAALVLAMFPLLLANGPGGGARFAMGLVIATGMSIGTLFTLFVLPTMYMYLGRDQGNTGEVVPAGF
jgi:multidrug efflux pump